MNWQMQLGARLERWPRRSKAALVVATDAFSAGFSVWMAYSLLTGTLHVPHAASLSVSALAVIVAPAVFLFSGLYRAVVRHTGLRGLQSIVKASAYYVVAQTVLIAFFLDDAIPLTVQILQPLLFLLMVGGARVLARIVLGDSIGRRSKIPRATVVIYGAGAAGLQLSRALASGANFKLVGFLDDDRTLWGSTINGLRIYRPSQLSEIITSEGVTDVLLALPSVGQARRLQILEELRPLAVHVRTIPGLSALAEGSIAADALRELDVEDLLGRDPVPPKAVLMQRNTTGRIVLVTGAGGSIGSELCRQIFDCQPTTLIIVDHSEFNLYSIHAELTQRVADGRVKIVALLANVSDFAAISRIVSVWRPDAIYHAAAYKHVPLVEHNVAEGIRNNVIGTLATAVAAINAGVANFVLVSTDKAVRPTNVMGASKRLAELVLQALASETNPVTPQFIGAPVGNPCNSTCFSMVRFGNVLDSSGSVVPKFRQQIRDGGPITLTHPDVTRYFMTIPEAAQLVIQAGAMSVGGDVFVLDMGLPIRIADLAHRMVELSGLTIKSPDSGQGDIEILTTGLRPGEKLFEELLIGNSPQATQHSRIMKAQEAYLPWKHLLDRLTLVVKAIESNSVPTLYALLGELVDGFASTGDCVDELHLASGKSAQKSGETTTSVAGPLRAIDGGKARLVTPASNVARP